MSTTAQIHANRANAQHSTGPTTDAGKSTASRNSLKHGLASEQLVLPNEDVDAFNELLTGLISEHQPATLTETLLVQDMAKYYWLADRALLFQNRAIVNEMITGDFIPPALGVLIRYHNAHKRAFEKALATFNSLKKLRLSEIGSAPQQPAATPPPQTLVTYTAVPPMEEIIELFNQGYEFDYQTMRYHPVQAA